MVCKVDAEKMRSVIQVLGGNINAGHSHIVMDSVNIGHIDGVVYRVQAVRATKLDYDDSASIPDWARCVEATES